VLRRSAHRLATACLVVLSLLFSQFALAAYVCPQHAETAAMASVMAAGLPCEGMDLDQPALCAGHSAATPQSFEATKLPTPSVPAIVQMIELPLVSDEAHAHGMPPATAAGPRPPPEPVFLSTLRLRV